MLSKLLASLSLAAVHAQSGLSIFGLETKIAEGEMFPSLVDGTRFPKACVGSMSNRVFRLVNDGSTAITVTDISVDLPAFGVSPTSVTVLAGTSADFVVTFTPTQSGEADGVVSVKSGAGISKFGIGARGAVPMMEAQQYMQPLGYRPLDLIDFGSVSTGVAVKYNMVMVNTVPSCPAATLPTYAVQGTMLGGVPAVNDSVITIATGEPAIITFMTNKAGVYSSGIVDLSSNVVVNVKANVTSAPTPAVVPGAPTPGTPACEGINGVSKDTYQDTCKYYADTSGPFNRCAKYGNTMFPSVNKTANQLCCACNGGIEPPTNAPQCLSYVLTNGPWHDSFGVQYTCAWYAAGADRCAKYGAGDALFGFTAQKACCECGGGAAGGVNNVIVPPPTPGTAPTPSAKCTDVTLASGGKWHDGAGAIYTCDWYAAQPIRCQHFGAGDPFENKVAQQACCVCGGGVTTAVAPTMTCSDLTWAGLPWDDGYTGYGGAADCTWYKAISNRCNLYGDLVGKGGYSAKDACCACKGSQ